MPSSPTHVVVGLGFGDEGKGTTVDFLVREHGARTVVRFNGGAQAAHHVVAPDGRHHCFAQFGAGSLVDGCCTVLSRFIVVDPLALVLEAEALIAVGVRRPFERLQVDPRCVVLTPYHRLMNRALELSRGGAAHGSCGIGVGQAQLDGENPGVPTLRFGDLSDPAKTRRILRHIQMVKLDQAEQLADAHRENTELAVVTAELAGLDLGDLLVERYGRVARHCGLRVAEDLDGLRDTPCVFEGAQGVLLDRDFGFWPHVTPSHTTFRNADALLDALGDGREVVRVGVLRAYATRHGYGPFVSEEASLGAAITPCHNQSQRWQGPFRLGWFDAPLARYALRVCGGVDGIMLTNVDRLAGLERVQVCIDYASAEREGLPPASELLSACASTSPEDFGQRTTLSAALTAAVPVLADVDGVIPAGGVPLVPTVEFTAQRHAELGEHLAERYEACGLLDAKVRWLSAGPSAREKWSRT